VAQVKIYALRETIAGKQLAFSDAIHAVVMQVLGVPKDKRAHRFFPLDSEDFFMPEGRSKRYTILEIMMMSGRTQETRFPAPFRLSRARPPS
jgi:hypothetical protein